MARQDNGEAEPKAVAWRRRKEFRESEILEAAVTLLNEVGIDAISILEIARRAGVSEATIYKYFENRQEIVARAMSAALTPTIDELETEMKLIIGCEAKLRFFLARIVRDMADRPNVHRATHGLMRWSGEYKNVIRDLHRRFAGLVTGILEEGVKSGELIADTDVVLAGDMVFGGLETIGWRSILSGREMRTTPADFAASFARQLFRGIEQASQPEQPLIDRVERLLAKLDERR